MQRAGRTGRDADVQALARGVGGFGRAFAKLKPDVVLVLGDRIEAFAAATAASIGGIRVAHVHGGDRAEGVADEAMRHAISKLAHLHLPATVQSRKRLVQMGEDPRCVFNVGSPAVDAIRDVTPAPDVDFIVLQHPIGAADEQEERWMRQTLRAVHAVAQRMKRDTVTILGSPNLDPGREGIVRSICAGTGVSREPIGPRQNGREKPANVIDCDYGERSVRAALDRALRLDLRRVKHPYGDGHTGDRIADLLATIDLAAVPLRKRNAY
jgi:UDP-hydrolysing UDP-N-acetyl-D-glucosamine 2-epimerase